MAERTEREELLSFISDVYKDVYGVRPRGLYMNHTLEELRYTFKELCAASERQMAEEAEIEAANAKTFEARVAEVIATGAGDRATALRWIFEADDMAEDVAIYGGTYASYHLGLPHLYFEAEYPSYPKAA